MEVCFEGQIFLLVIDYFWLQSQKYGQSYGQSTTQSQFAHPFFDRQ